MKSFLFPFSLLVVAASCQQVQVKGPVGDMQTTVRWGPIDGPKRKPAALFPLYQNLVPGQIILEYAEQGLSFSGKANPANDPIAKKANALASIAGEVIGHELGLGFSPGFTILLVECLPEERVAVSGAVPIAFGSSAALRICNGQVEDSDYGNLLTMMAHEYSEAQLTFPDNLNCNLYHGSPYHRWVGEGVAELITSLCEKRARESGIRFLAPGELQLHQSDFGTRSEVNLSHWKSPHYVDENDEIDWTEQRLRYLGSEYLIWLYYQGALEKGTSYPIARLAKWIGFHSPSPTPEALIAWMEMTSEVELSARVESLSVKEILDYQRNRFSLLPLRTYSGREVAPRNNWIEFEALYTPNGESKAD